MVVSNESLGSLYRRSFSLSAATEIYIRGLTLLFAAGPFHISCICPSCSSAGYQAALDLERCPSLSSLIELPNLSVRKTSAHLHTPAQVAQWRTQAAATSGVKKFQLLFKVRLHLRPDDDDLAGIKLTYLQVSGCAPHASKHIVYWILQED